MISYSSPRLGLEDLPVDEPLSLIQDFRGIRYSGEVIRASRWNPAWGSALEGDVYFRIVLLVRRQGVTSARSIQVQDQRIAVCTPGAVVSRELGKISGELSVIRETRARYLTQRSLEARFFEQSLTRRQQDLEDDLRSEEAARYAVGTVLAGPDRVPFPGNPFVGSEPTGWFSNIAEWLLKAAYPAFPLSADERDEPFSDTEAKAVFDSLFHQPIPGLNFGASSLDGLGLPASGPSKLSGLIEDYLIGSQGSMGWKDVHRYLAHQVGLTGSLATLHLLRFLQLRVPPLEMRLSAGYHPELVNGGTFYGSRLTADLLPILVWDSDLGNNVDSMGAATEPEWNDALPYLGLLSSGLQPAEFGSAQTQEGRLLADVEALKGRCSNVGDFLELLEARGTGDDIDDLVRPFSQALARLVGLDEQSFSLIYRSIKKAYSAPGDLVSDLRRLDRVYSLGKNRDVLKEIWAYLDAVPDLSDQPDISPELNLELQALRAATRPAGLLRFSQSWGALEAQINRCRRRYGTTYGAHHAFVQRHLPEYLRSQEKAILLVTGLELLNTLPELSPAVGEGWRQRLKRLEFNGASCDISARRLAEALIQRPSCPQCGLSLTDALPYDELQDLLRGVEFDLGVQTRRLSNLLVQRLMNGTQNQQLNDLLKIAEASDMAALSNTLNPELVEFIGRALR